MSDLLMLLVLFAVLALASEQIGRGAKRLHLPVITGFLLAGVLIGPYVLGALSSNQVARLGSLDEVALAFIAFAAGAELNYREIRQQLRRIWWITLGIVIASYALVVPLLMWVGDRAPFLEGMGPKGQLAIGLIAAAILVSRSPSSLIALVADLRARGPFTRLLLGITVALDVVVIVLFAIGMSVADTLLRGSDFRASLVLLVLTELVVAGVAGVALAAVLKIVLRYGRSKVVQSLLVLATGLGAFALSGWLRDMTHSTGTFELVVEPLLACMVAGFLVSNFTDYRADFKWVLKATGPTVFVVFFTLAGASLDLAALRLAWGVALLLFVARLLAIILGSYFGGLLSGAPPKVRRLTWLGLLTQAGIGLGLAKKVAVDYPDWGSAFATTIMAVIVVNQIIGPPAEKWVLGKMGEARADLAEGVRGAPRVLIFGLDGQSGALARQLADHGWRPVLVSRRELPEDEPTDIELAHIPELSAEALRGIGAEAARTLVGLMRGDDNVELCRIAHDELGVSNVVVRVGNQEAAARCQEYGATAIDPAVALVNVLDQFVRSPALTELVVGMNVDRDITEVEVVNPELNGVAIRNLQLPLDVLVLSVRRGGASLISHGYTRLHRGDLVTLMGHRASLERVAGRLLG